MRYEPQGIHKLIALIAMGASFPSLKFRYRSCPDFTARAFAKRPAEASATAPVQPPSESSSESSACTTQTFEPLVIAPLPGTPSRGGRQK